MLALFRRSIAYLESADIPLWYFVLTFFSAVMVRHFLETFSSTYNFGVPQFFDYTLSYVSIGLGLTLLLHLLTGERVYKVARIVGIGCILIVPPIIDFTLGGGLPRFQIGAILPGGPSLLFRFFTFFGPLGSFGITPGMRIEVALVLIGAALYVYEKRRSLMWSAAGVLAVYALLFFFVSIPTTLAVLCAALHIPLGALTELITTRASVLIIALEALALAFLLAPRSAWLIMKDIRPEKLVHYWLMFGIGLAAGGSSLFLGATAPRLDGSGLLSIALMLTSIACAWAYCVITNNMADTDIDRVSNAHRPLVRGELPIPHYRIAAWGTLAGALACAAAIGFWPFFLISLFIGIYFLYSMPPVRFKRVPYLSKLSTFVNSAALVMLGFIFWSSTSLAMGSRIPTNLDRFYFLVYHILHSPLLMPVLIVLMTLLMAMQYIDLKDYEGDRQAGIQTLPVILGLGATRLMVAASFIILYLAPGLALAEARLLMLGAAASMLTAYALYRKPYREEWVTVAYLASLIAFLVAL